MTDGHDDRWWGDEAPVRTDRRSVRSAEPGEAPGDDVPDHDGRAEGTTNGNGGDRVRRDPLDPSGGTAAARTARPQDGDLGSPAPPEREPRRSPPQVFIPPPEDLPPFEEVVDPIYPPVRDTPDLDPDRRDAGHPHRLGPRRPEPLHPEVGQPDPGQPDVGRPDASRAADAGYPGLGAVPGAGLGGLGIPDPGPVPEAGLADGPSPLSEPGPVAEPSPSSGPRPASVFVPPPDELPPFDEVVDPIYLPGRDVPDADALGLDDAGGVPPAPVLVAGPGLGDDVPAAPDLSRPRTSRPAPESPDASTRRPVDRRRLAVVYDVEGPRVRLGVAWFAGAMAATLLHPAAAALVYAVAAGFAARQIVRAWGSVPWQADVAAGLGAVPVVAALAGAPGLVGAVVLALIVAVGAACAPDGARLPGSGGRLAAAGILVLAVVPALGAGAFVLVAGESKIAAVVLLGIVSVYEMGDYIVGSGATNPVEGPLAGITTSSLVALPLALVLVEPYDAGGLVLIGIAAAACPLGQIVASAVLPGAGAHAPALRRIDTLLVLAPVWAAAVGAF